MVYDGIAARWLRRLEAALLPHVCLLCGGRAEGMDLCRGCHDDLPWNRSPCPRCANPLPPSAPGTACGDCQAGRIDPALDCIRAPLVYDYPVDRLVLGLKYAEKLAHARMLGELMAANLLAAARVASMSRPVAVVPVPLHGSRLRERGFNQAHELARPVARALGLPLRPRLLKRTRHSEPQSRLPLAQRRSSIRGQFATRGPVPARIAVIDDVVTSGSTACEIARVLKAAGAEWVEVWACARTN
jgi:ComF family protein